MEFSFEYNNTEYKGSFSMRDDAKMIIANFTDREIISLIGERVEFKFDETRGKYFFTINLNVVSNFDEIYGNILDSILDSFILSSPKEKNGHK